MATLYEGDHIEVHETDKMGFEHVTEMLLEHFDVPQHAGKTFILGDNIFHPAQAFREAYPGRKIVIYQLEQMVGSATWHATQRIMDNLAGADEVWDYDPLNVEFLNWHGVEVDRVVPLIYTERLRRIELEDDPRMDVLFPGTLNERRFRIFEKLQAALYGEVRMMWITGVYGPDFEDYVADTRIVLNLHAFEPWHRQEQTRIFFPLINGRLVISETSERNWLGDCIVEADIDDLAATIRHWLAEDRWRVAGLAASERYRERSLRWKEADALLD